MALAMSAFYSCDDNELLFDKTAAERLNETKAVYSERLWASPNGWAMQYYPTNDNEAPKGRGYLLLCRFYKDGSVDVAMKNSASNNYYDIHEHSLWEILIDNGPVLSFNSYNHVLHTFSSPEFLDKGRGYEGDYEFIIVDAPADGSYLMLKGKKRGTYNLLTPLDSDVDYEQYLNDISAFQDKMFASDAPTFNVINFGDSIYKMEDANDGIPNIYPYNGDKVMEQSFNPFLITKRGDDFYLRFRDKHEVTPGGETVQDFRYDAEQDMFVSVDNDHYTITGDQPSRFFQQTIRSGSNQEWSFSRSGVMSDAMKTIVNSVNTAMRGLRPRATLNKFRLVNYNGDFCVDINFNNTQHAYFPFKQTPDAKGVTMELQTVTDEQAMGMYNQLEAVRELLGTLSQQFVITAEETVFNLKRMKFTCVSNPDLWFIIELLTVNENPT